MKTFFTLSFMLVSLLVESQNNDIDTQKYKSSTENMMQLDRKLTIGGYAQIDYNQPLKLDTKQNGNLDVHRMVMLFGYKFNNRTQFFTEIEYEHVSEVYIEQAFIDYKISDFIHFRTGLMLIPMGIINEYHEPPSFNGVERPFVDKYIVPTTWRELGFGFTGNIPSATLKYQLYIVNGFKSYDGENYFLSGKSGLRKGRQKGAESFVSSPNISGKVDYYGLPGLNIGLAGYYGKTQSKAYDNTNKSDELAQASADSTVIGISMMSIDLRYQLKGLQLRGQFSYSAQANTKQYNTFIPNDPLGNTMLGYYIEAGYDVFQPINKIKYQLIPFVRFEFYNLHHKVDEGVTANNLYHNQIITAGIGWKTTPKVAFKADFQFIKSNSLEKHEITFNAGIGLMF